MIRGNSPAAWYDGFVHGVAPSAASGNISLNGEVFLNFLNDLRLRAAFFVVLCAAAASLLFATAAASAQQPTHLQRVEVVHSYRNDVSPPLSLNPIPYVGPGEESEERHEGPENPPVPRHHIDSPDPVVQHTTAPTPLIPGTILNFDGITQPGGGCGCAPPDTDGEVGDTQFVQIVNAGLQVFAKATGNSLLGPISISSVWSGFTGVCQNNGNGDPVVLYDQLAHRWLISQFAGTSVPTDECIAVSTSDDATGTWNRYGFHLGTNFFDYPKLAVWPDGYYMSMNVFNAGGTSYLGPQPFVFDRTAMIAGNPATFITTGILGNTHNPIMPADLDGSTLPPVGAPNPFLETPDNTYQVYGFHADFTTPANSTFNLIGAPAAAGYTFLCGGNRNCVPQSGTSQKVDGIGDRLMFRLAYRNFGDHDAVVGNFSVGSGGVAGIRWFELRNPTASPTVYQESTYQPDTTWRWMGSVAMDGSGDLAVGYSASSSSLNPQVRYTGRLVGDPLNSLPQGEQHLFDGAGSQTGGLNRWGDYSAMSIDPVDDCTFWYTNEYIPTNGSFNWKTRIGNFKFAECGATGITHVVTPSVGTPSGAIAPSTPQTVNDGATTSFTLTPAGGYHINNVGGTCGGTLAGNVFTTNAVTADCTVIVNFATGVLTHVVAPSVGTPSGTIAPSTPQTVNDGATTSFTLTPAGGYQIANVGGTCGGTLAGDVFTTSAVTADCTVIANFASTGGSNGIISSGPLDHSVMDSVDGTSLNIVTSVFDDTGPVSGDWDFNFWDNSGFAFYTISTYNTAYVVDGSGDAVVLHVGDVIGSGSTFSTGASVTAAAGWLSGTDAYAGVRFNCDGRLTFPVPGTVCYGYIHITTTGATGFPATIDDTSFDGDGNPITIVGGVPSPPTVAKAFSPDTVVANTDSTATIALTNPNATVATLTANLVDTLPTGLAASAVSTTCGGTASLTAGTLTLASGATIPANSSCTLSGTVRASTAGSYVNTIPAGALVTDAGSNSSAASATLAVTAVTHVVTPSVGTPSGTIAPSTPQTVNDGATTSFTLTPDAGYQIDNVGGTCGGTLAGNVFTTSAVTADCTVIVNFVAATYSVGGTVSGLTGSGLVLNLNGTENLPIAADGNFTFASLLADGGTYTVTVGTQPGNPDQTCSVANGTGTIAGANVTDVAVTCGADDTIFKDGFDGPQP